MMDFILNNFEAVAGVLLAGILIIYALVTRQWSVLQMAAIKFMIDAERLMKTKEGTERMEAVYVESWEKLPYWLKKFVTEKTLREKLQDWYNFMRDSLNEISGENQQE
jgi:hypothetical protein